MTDCLEKPVNGQDFATIALDVKRYIGFLSDLGCRGFDCSKETLDILSCWDKPRRLKTGVTPGIQVNSGQDPMERLRAEWGDCSRCSRAGHVHGPVFGSGDPQARLMVIGDVPGLDESGQLLTKMIEGMGLTRDAVYITTVLKCRPPENRKPLPDEITACLPVLERQIRTVNPDVICTLGAFATQALLGHRDDVAQLRGHFQAYRSCQVLPTFHPDYLLRNPASKRDAWEDLKKIMGLLGLQRK